MIDSDSRKLRASILRSLKSQGFLISQGKIVPPDPEDKERIRDLHRKSVTSRLELARPGLRRHESELLQFIANGNEIDPKRINPKLVSVRARSRNELLFRWAKLHWSIPVSAGYGRRLRFLILDRTNDKLIGIIGLGDPVCALSARDQWIGWNPRQRRERLRHVLDAFVLGAVPPYSQILGGKLIAMLCSSSEVRRAFGRKYGGRRSLIRKRRGDGRLALITTTSALGRSSIYNRLILDNKRVMHSVGFTRGSGEFHFANGVYSAILESAREQFEPTAKHANWGTGFRNRREVVRRLLRRLDLCPDLLYHGINREVFVLPLAYNTDSFLRGDTNRLKWIDRSAGDIADFCRARWIVPRSESNKTFEQFHRDQYALWP